MASNAEDAVIYTPKLCYVLSLILLMGNVHCVIYKAHFGCCYCVNTLVGEARARQVSG